MIGAMISAVDVAAAHDGEAELRLTLRFANGGHSQVTLDEFATRTLMTRSNAHHADQLVGLGWEPVRDALMASSNRFAAVSS